MISYHCLKRSYASPKCQPCSMHTFLNSLYSFHLFFCIGWSAICFHLRLNIQLLQHSKCHSKEFENPWIYSLTTAHCKESFSEEGPLSLIPGIFILHSHKSKLLKFLITYYNLSLIQAFQIKSILYFHSLLAQAIIGD